jgi:hypothetical protein
LRAGHLDEVAPVHQQLPEDAAGECGQRADQEDLVECRDERLICRGRGLRAENCGGTAARARSAAPEEIASPNALGARGARSAIFESIRASRSLASAPARSRQ